MRNMLRSMATVVFMIALTLPALAAEKENPFVLPGDITLEQANSIIDAAQKKATATNTLMNIAVVDAGGNLKAFARMDGAFLGSIDIACNKARTARYFNMTTQTLGEASQPGKPLYGIEVTNNGLTIFGGGELLKNAEGTIIGAIGVSGGSVEEDIAVAQAGVAALTPTAKKAK